MATGLLLSTYHISYYILGGINTILGVIAAQYVTMSICRYSVSLSQHPLYQKEFRYDYEPLYMTSGGLDEMFSIQG